MSDGPEFRANPYGQPVVVAAARSSRPHDAAPAPVAAVPAASFDPACPFCTGNEAQTPPEVAAVRPDGSLPDTPGWLCRVVPNKYPALAPGEPGAPWEGASRPALGVHEVLVHSPDHSGRLSSLPAPALARALRMWRTRIAAAHEAGWIGTNLIVNEGKEAGASLAHPHAQLFATDVPGPQLEAEWGAPPITETASAEADGPREIDREGDLLAWCPFWSSTPFEIWIAPREAGGDFVHDDRSDALAALLGRAAQRLQAAAGDPALNLVVRDGMPGGTWHVRLLPRTSTPAGFEAATGFRVLTVAPEAAAATLRQAPLFS